MRRPALAVLTALALLALPGSAAAADATRQAIFKECQAGAITSSYSSGELSDALRNIQTDVDEYSDCRDIIRRARLAAAGGGGGNGDTGAQAGAAGGGQPGAGGGAPGTGGGGGTAADLLKSASPAEQAAVTRAISAGGAAPVDVGGRSVSPDSAGLSPAGAGNVVPTPLIVALVLLGLGLAAAGTQTVRSLVVARRTPAT